MSLWTYPSLVKKVTCDATDCHAEFVPVGELHEHGADLRPVLAAAGWVIWKARGWRYYCPSHEPRPGHKMRRLA